MTRDLKQRVEEQQGYGPDEYDIVMKSDNISYISDILDDFISFIGISLGLSEHGVLAENVPNLAKLAYEDICHTTHPFPIAMEDFTAVYTRAL